MVQGFSLDVADEKKQWSVLSREPAKDENEISECLNQAIHAMIELQHEEGYWCGELEGDSILQSEYILLKFIIGEDDDPRLPKIARYLRSQQSPESGGWLLFPGSHADLSASVKAYLALKLMGDSVDEPHMKKARQTILDLGGAEHCNTYSKFYLAALGQIPWDSVPSVPPEFILAPKWLFFHIDKVSSWTRTMIMPFAIISHYQPVRPISDQYGIKELFCEPERIYKPFVNDFDRKLFTWKNFFLVVDRLLKLWQKSRLLPFRRYALRRIERWILQHTQSHKADGMGAIFPPMVYNLIAFRCLGYDPNGDIIREASAQLDRFMIEDQDSIHLQPCFSPVWDTGIALYALTEAGLDASQYPIKQACCWLLEKECRESGDWVANVKQKVEPSGWFFEYNNAFFPDVDDTAMVTMALRNADEPHSEEAIQRGINWILAMQNDDGGWAAFDRTKNRPILEAIPFADHNAIQDPSCPDITGRVLECLGRNGITKEHPSVKRAIQYLQQQQNYHGCWFGRWGVNYVYGTWEVLCGLKAVGVNMKEPWIQKAGHWLKSVQHDNGAFGESANSYEDLTQMGIGPATPSQTAWGAMGLMAVFGCNDPSVANAVEWLVDTQDENGCWHDDYFTGTGFPRVFYLRYHLYAQYFPIMAIGRFLHERL